MSNMTAKQNNSMGYFNDYAIANNQVHPIAKLFSGAIGECEKLPASEQQTKTVVAIGKCKDAIEQLLSDRDTHARQMAVDTLVEWRNKLYDSIPTGEVNSFDFTKAIKGWMDNVDTFTASTDRKDAVLICNDCKKFHIAPKSECECGCKTLTVTHESNRSLVNTDRKEDKG